MFTNFLFGFKILNPERRPRARKNEIPYIFLKCNISSKLCCFCTLIMGLYMNKWVSESQNCSFWKYLGKTCLNLGLFYFSDLFFRSKAKPWPILDHKMITSVFVSLYYWTIDMYLSNKNKLHHNYNCLLFFFWFAPRARWRAGEK